MTKRNKIIYWIATIWLSLGMLSTGAVQLLKVKGDGPGSVDSMTHLGYPVYFVTILGICKILGVVALLIPKFPLLKEWAYAGFFFDLIGATYSQIASSGFVPQVAFMLVPLTLCTLSYIYFRKRLKVSTLP